MVDFCLVDPNLIDQWIKLANMILGSLKPDDPTKFSRDLFVFVFVFIFCFFCFFVFNKLEFFNASLPLLQLARSALYSLNKGKASSLFENGSIYDLDQSIVGTHALKFIFDYLM